ncbi:MAG TPA: hypothetical protein VN739_00105 [Nitrososphaerales archaeon]|nr:hypothetical protein [Nitrososphaerales archaeon]
MPLFGSKHKPEAAKQIQEQVPKKLTLKDLVPNDEKMYLALQTFLLGDPERQLPMLGNTDALLAKGDQDKANGEKLKARMNYETAAKIEIYKQNKELVEKSLRLSKEVTENVDPRRELLETMLANIDEVLRISKLYSNSVAHRNK